MQHRTLNLGILAHVDAGKTTLTERLLYAAGVIDELGSVDHGNTQTDTLALERQRGITIKSAVVSFAIEVFLAPVSGSGVVHGLFVPSLPNSEATLLAVGIIGATVMPHVIYLHSALTQKRIVGRVTWINIDEADQSEPVLRLGSSGLPVRRLQSRMTAVGFDTGDTASSEPGGVVSVSNT